jgi:putative hydrolase of the HAD superfamily
MNKEIEHFSFDLWFTIIKSDPNFKSERATYFQKKFNKKNKSIEQIISIFREVDLMCNAINEKTGKNICSEEMYFMVLYLINESNEIFKDLDINLIYSEIEKIFFNFPPQIFDRQTLYSLDFIKDTGKSMNILSNTAFIKGETLRKLLKEMKLEHFFCFQIYSDEIGYSKPDFEIFNLMYTKVKEYKKKDVDKNKIIHIGDNILSDIKGAQNFGFESMQINTNNHSIINLVRP